MPLQASSPPNWQSVSLMMLPEARAGMPRSWSEMVARIAFQRIRPCVSGYSIPKNQGRLKNKKQTGKAKWRAHEKPP